MSQNEENKDNPSQDERIINILESHPVRIAISEESELSIDSQSLIIEHYINEIQIELGIYSTLVKSDAATNQYPTGNFQEGIDELSDDISEAYKSTMEKLSRVEFHYIDGEEGNPLISAYKNEIFPQLPENVQLQLEATLTISTPQAAADNILDYFEVDESNNEDLAKVLENSDYDGFIVKVQTALETCAIKTELSQEDIIAATRDVSPALADIMEVEPPSPAPKVNFNVNDVCTPGRH